MSDEDKHFGDLRSEQLKIERQLADWLPKAGDRLFIGSNTGAYVDPLGFSAPGGQRSLTGRWQLYSGGFLAGGDRLADGCRGLPHEDALVYPILSLYRHHLELELKYVLFCCPNCTEDVRQWLRNKHCLRDLWDKVEELYPRLSVWASPECTGACRKLIYEFSEHDLNSQSSRYPIDKKGNQTLTRLEVVDLPTLKLGVHKISHYLGTIIEQIGEDRDWEAEMASW